MGFIYLPDSPRLESPWGQSLCLSFISTTSAQYTTSLTNVLFIHSFITALISTPSRMITSLSLSMLSLPSLKLSLLPLAWNIFYYLFHSSVYFFNFSVTNHCNTSDLWENDPAVFSGVSANSSSQRFVSLCGLKFRVMNSCLVRCPRALPIKNHFKLTL